MACCSGYCAAEEYFSQKVADRDLQRYRRDGPDIITRLLLEELRRWPLEGRRLLDVGGGIGVIGAEVSGAGLASLTMVDASPSYLETARMALTSRYDERVLTFIHGDFAAIAATVADADVVTLDRVVCCYPEAQPLLGRAAAKARELLAFTYPRERWHVRIWVVLENGLLWLRRSKFRAFFHPPAQMRALLEAAGFARVTQRETFLWALDVYRRKR